MHARGEERDGQEGLGSDGQGTEPDERELVTERRVGSTLDFELGTHDEHAKSWQVKEGSSAEKANSTSLGRKLPLLPPRCLEDEETAEEGNRQRRRPGV